MCISIPAKVIKIIDNNYVLVSRQNRKIKVKTFLISKVKKNDWLLTNADIAISKITFSEAKAINEHLKNIC